MTLACRLRHHRACCAGERGQRLPDRPSRPTDPPRVLLIAPTALDGAGRPIRQRRIYLPGLTLPILAAVTPREAHIRLVAEAVHDIPYDEPWDIVGITTMGSGIVGAWRIADEFSRRGRTVVLGGMGATLLDVAANLAHADAVVLGEAEETWPRVIADAAAGRLRSVYTADRLTPIDRIPLPRYDLLDRKRLGFWLPVQATRGCPHRCDYCSVTAFFGQRYRKRPIPDVIRDVREVVRLGVRRVALIDDNIGVDWDYCAALFEALIPERITWMSQCSIHIADRPDILRLARRSGCTLLSVGLESASAASLARHGKPFNRPEHFPAALGAIRAHGIDVSVELMIGLEEDDASVFERIFRLVVDNDIAVPRVHILTPVPGTPLYERLDGEGRILSHDLAGYTGGTVVFRPNRIEAKQLQQGYWKLYRRLFTPWGIARRMARNPARLGVFMRAFELGVNLHYRNHIRHGITPGIV